METESRVQLTVRVCRIDRQRSNSPQIVFERTRDSPSAFQNHTERGYTFDSPAGWLRSGMAQSIRFCYTHSCGISSVSGGRYSTSGLSYVYSVEGKLRIVAGWVPRTRSGCQTFFGIRIVLWASSPRMKMLSSCGVRWLSKMDGATNHTLICISEIQIPVCGSLDVVHGPPSGTAS